MARSKSKHLPPTQSVRELVDFFDTHDMGEYWDQMAEANFDVDLKKKTHLIAIDEAVFGKLTEIAKSKRVSSKMLIDSWLKDKIRRAG